MQMEKLVAGLWSQFGPHAFTDHNRLDELDQIISKLEQKRVELAQRLTQETSHARIHRIEIAQEVARLQLEKAQSLRLELQQE